MSPISVLLPTGNPARTVRATLESVKWADEILVVNSCSTDETLDICRGYGARVIQHEYINSAKQKNRALPQSRTSGCCRSTPLRTSRPIDVRAELPNGLASAGVHRPPTR
jgi:glycosyltransferase involved in cell wall biosynthesis